MLLLAAKLIKIKSWAVSCAKRRVGCGQLEQCISPEFCVSWPRNSHLVMLTQYIFICWQSKLYLKDTHLVVDISVRRKNETALLALADAHLAACLFISDALHVFAFLLWFRLFPFYLAIERRDKLAHVLAELKTNITVCEPSLSQWRISINAEALKGHCAGSCGGNFTKSHSCPW